MSVILTLGVTDGWGALAGSDVPQEANADSSNKGTVRSRIKRADFRD
ncbi:MAG: hypothetical protein ACK2UE_12385 [Anaerolineales bacterium]